MKVNTYAQFLKRFKWDLFGTLTSQFKLSLASARRAIERVYKILTKKYRINSFYWCAETFSQLDSYHLHILIQFNDHQLSSNKKAALVHTAWKTAIGQKDSKEIPICTIRKYKKDAGGEEYFTKMISNKIGDYDLYCN